MSQQQQSPRLIPPRGLSQSPARSSSGGGRTKRRGSNRPLLTTYNSALLRQRANSISSIDDNINELRVLKVYSHDNPAPVPLHFTPTEEELTSTFWNDVKTFRPGSVPHSTIVGITIGVFLGFIAFAYYYILEFSLKFFWKTLPQLVFIPYISESLFWLWIPIIGYAMSIGVGLSVKLLGEPGDLSYTVERVHGFGYIGMDHILPMLFASQFSILGGGSLGPEAPLVAICASFSGYISRKIFKCNRMNLIRKHTLMGMSCALAAFFGVPLGGSLFALEINNRMGIEYYEHVVESIFSGTVCLCVFRSLTQQSMGSIWEIEENQLEQSTPKDVGIGAIAGLIGAIVAWMFSLFHLKNMSYFRKYGLLKDENMIQRAIVGATIIVIIGIFIPRTMFWGEEEFEVIATGSPASELPNVWPTGGLLGLEINNFHSAIFLGVCKMIVISFTVAGGYRGGFIFPFFAAGAAFGKGICFLLPMLSPTIMTLCIAAGINVAITRTALATTLILCALSGEINAGPPVLAASMISLFVTKYMPFIRTQVTRSDIRRVSLSGSVTAATQNLPVDPNTSLLGDMSFDDVDFSSHSIESIGENYLYDVNNDGKTTTKVGEQKEDRDEEEECDVAAKIVVDSGKTPLTSNQQHKKYNSMDVE